MAVFIIAYDLRKPDFDYQPLYDALAKVKAKHLQDSIWGINTSSSAEVVFDYLWGFMHNAKDRLFVIPFDKVVRYKSENAISLLKDV
jgi:hypothetical protein